MNDRLTEALYFRALDVEYQAGAFHAWHRKRLLNVAWLPHAWTARAAILSVLRWAKWLLPTLMPLWLFMVVPALALREAFIIWHARNQPSRAQQPLPEGCTLFLGSSIVAPLKEAAKVTELPTLYLQLPWRESTEALPAGMVRIDLAHLVRPSDLLHAFINVWGATAWYCLRPALWRLVLYNYMGFRWHLVRRLLKRIKPSAIWTSNHFDRWAIMIDGLNIPQKTMVQHGQLTLTSIAEVRAVCFEPKPKLQSTWRLLHFTQDALETFSKHIFNSPIIAHMAFSVDIDVFDPEPGAPVVLIIGAPHIHREQAADMRRLRQGFGDRIRLFYRPHPRACSNGIDTLLKEVGAHVEPNRVPRAAACMSYPSTLNSALDSRNIRPVFVFNYDDATQADSMRRDLHGHLARVLEDSISVG